MLNFMKSHFSGKKIILLFIVFCSMSFGQDWNPTVQTSINEPNVEKMDLTANASGVHVLIKRTSGNIVYYYLNSSGIVTTGKTYTMEADGDFPNIVASNNNVYALYKTGSNIKGKYSTNGGTSWINLPDRNIGSNLCYGVDAVYELGNGVHLVWATRDDNPNFKTYYSRLRPADHEWVELQNVTSHASGFYGGNPTVTVSSGRVHVGFNTNYFDYIGNPGDAKTRDRLNGVWQIPQTVVSGAEQSVDEKLLVRGDTLYMFYSKFISGSPLRHDLFYRIRSVSGTTWSSPSVLKNSIMETGNAFSGTKTYDDQLHILYRPESSDEFGYIKYNGSSWSSPITIGSNIKLWVNPGFASVSNDLFMTWSQTNDGFLRYKQYDAAPLAPQNLAVTKSSNNHPLLSWSRNNEPDIQHYKIYKWTYAELGWFHYATTTSTSFEDVNEIIQSGGAHANERWVYYRVTAVDQYPQESPNSNQVGIKVKGAALDKFSTGTEVYDYSLAQNYPNPFNPSTKISYSIKEDGFVTLKVYDILGVEIATLVNEQKTAGSYEADFNAASLPSGMYIYKLHAGSFTDVKKMLLTK
jgi:hypothetical protein